MAEQTQAPVLPDGAISEWRPSRASVVAWTILSLPITALVGLVYLKVAIHGANQIAGEIGLVEILVAAALTFGLAAVR
jgi:hypothetical protein